jgi:segregation and condensation protein B
MAEPAAEPTLDLTLEAILFTAAEPLTAAQLAAALGGVPVETVAAALAALSGRLSGGIRLAEAAGTYRLVSAPEAAGAVRKFLEDTSRQELSRPALETLSIVAYKGPLTKLQVEEIRGVASDTMLRNLLARGLITEAGRSSEPGRPALYAVSHLFLQHFGLTSAGDLPPLPKDANHED